MGAHRVHRPEPNRHFPRLVPEVPTYREFIRDATRSYLLRILDEAHGKVCVAASIAGMNRTHLHKVIGQIDPKLLDVAESTRRKSRIAAASRRAKLPRRKWEW